MTDFGQYDKYELNEKDIDSALNWLKIFHPESATPEHAIELLELMHASAHKMRHDTPESLEPYFQAMIENKLDKKD